MHLIYLAQHLSMAVLLVLCLFNMSWTIKSVVRPNSQLATFAAAIFWVSAGTAAFQLFALLGSANDVTRVSSRILLAIGFATAATLRRQVPLLRKFAGLLRYIEITSSIAALAEVDKETAERVARICRRKTAEAALRD